MAKELSPEAAAAEQERAKLKEEKKQFKNDQKAQKKEAKRRAAEIAKQEEALGEDGGSGVVTFAATMLIVVLWLAVICVIVKLDIGGFGSSVLTPILKDVPFINKILPGVSVIETTDPDSYGGYSSLEEAVAYIRQLEQDVERLQISINAKDADIEKMTAEVVRLQEFERRQSEFQRIMTEFYEDVVDGIGADEFMKYFESIDPATAEFLYKQAVIQEQESQEIQEFAERYSAMKPKQAAAAFEEMTDSLDLVAKILKTMSSEDSAKIMDNLSADTVARLTKIMNPDS